MDPWLFLLSSIGVRLLLTRLFVDLRVDRGIGDGKKSGLSLLGDGAMVLAKEFEDISSFYFIASALIYSTFLFSCKIFISTY